MASAREHERYHRARRLQEQGQPLAKIARRFGLTTASLTVSMSRVRSDLRAGKHPDREQARTGSAPTAPEPREPREPGTVEVALTRQQLAILLHTVQRVQSDHEVLGYVAPTLGYRQDLARAGRALERAAPQLRESAGAAS